jgi:hypothetical protein
MIVGVGEFGCGFEAQLESWYRFLIQPDPYLAIERVDAYHVHLAGLDETILKQRHDFLRPDSMVGIVVFTDENDSTVDPLANEGQGWVWESSVFPGSIGGTAPRPTGACATHPMDPACTSCALAGPSTEASCSTNGGYYLPEEDTLGLRFFHMKQRFGLDPQFPIERYVNALSAPKVPDREGEHAGGSGPYLGRANCINPLFAARLPASAKDETCALPRGTRALDMVWMAVIGGVPNELLHFDPLSAQASKVTPEQWKLILGADPVRYDFTGVAPYMRESITPRAGLPPPTASDTADPIHGREWDTHGKDLQFACTFPFPTPRDCAREENKPSCDCGLGLSPPVCDPANPTQQIRGKAYPTVRELAVARALGDRGIPGSICPIHTVEQGPGDPLFGYRPAMKMIFDHVVEVIAH